MHTFTNKLEGKFSYSFQHQACVMFYFTTSPQGE
jgi:hypothetical protein